MALVRNPAETARSLLDAGAALAQEEGLGAIRVDAVVARAGTGKGTFYRHFENQDAFLVALHAKFAAEVSERVGLAVAGVVPGGARLRILAIAYLDACLGQRGLKAFLTEARVVAAVADGVERALAMFAQVVADDYAAEGWAHPLVAARLFVAMAHESALAEQRRGRRDRKLRETLLLMSGLSEPGGTL